MKHTPSNTEHGIITRVYSPLGRYSHAPFLHPDAAFIFAPDLVFSATRYTNPKIDHYYSEMEWANSYEIRLMAALLLPIEDDRIYPYPTDYCVRIPDTSDIDLSDRASLTKLSRILKSNLNSRKFLFGDKIHRPPLIGGYRYKFNDAGSNLERQRRIFEATDPADHLLVRGLGALIKARMLHQFFAFHENACISLYIAMDASLRIILKRLGAESKPQSQGRCCFSRQGLRISIDRWKLL